jgi:hypothetical protein
MMPVTGHRMTFRETARRYELVRDCIQRSPQFAALRTLGCVETEETPLDRLLHRMYTARLPHGQLSQPAFASPQRWATGRSFYIAGLLDPQ